MAIVRAECNGFLEIRPDFLTGEALDTVFMRLSELVRVQTPEDIKPGVPCLLERPEIVVFMRTCRQQRDVGFFRVPPTADGMSVAPYEYSNQQALAQDMPDWLVELMESVNADLGTSFNAVLVNHYADGSQYISKHRDSEKGLVPKSPVAAISVGATRTFRVREWPTGKKVADVPMPDGSLLVMLGPFQKMYTHEVPIEKKIKGERYSITFREHKLV